MRKSVTVCMEDAVARWTRAPAMRLAVLMVVVFGPRCAPVERGRRIQVVVGGGGANVVHEQYGCHDEHEFHAEHGQVGGVAGIEVANGGLFADAFFSGTRGAAGEWKDLRKAEASATHPARGSTPYTLLGFGTSIGYERKHFGAAGGVALQSDKNDVVLLPRGRFFVRNELGSFGEVALGPRASALDPRLLTFGAGGAIGRSVVSASIGLLGRPVVSAMDGKLALAKSGREDPDIGLLLDAETPLSRDLALRVHVTLAESPGAAAEIVIPLGSGP